MKPLIVLISAFITLFIVNCIWWGMVLSFKPGAAAVISLKIAGNAAMAVMLVFTAMGHFLFTKGMTMMIPPPVPFKRELVWLTGVFEAFAALCLLFPQHRVPAAAALIIFFILMLPANIYAVMHKVDYQKASYNGPGNDYLWFRVPLQILFIAWVWCFGICM